MKQEKQSGISRRDFLGHSTIFITGSAILGPLAGSTNKIFGANKTPVGSVRTQNGGHQAVSKPAWLRGPVINGGSNQEPLAFQLRRGTGLTTHTKEDYLRSHSEQHVREVKEFGATFFMTHLFKAYGLKAEGEDIDRAIKFSSLLHSYGLKVGTYVGSSLGFESFLVEMPEARDWLVPDYLGEPVIYGGTQYHRRRPYFQHPGYKKFIKKVLKIGIEKVKTDLIHFDNPANQACPPVFHHPLAIQHFREYLRKKYTPKQLEDRIGFGDVGEVMPPKYVHPERQQTFMDPVAQEWIDFRCQQLADYYKEMAAYIRELNPEVAVEVNPHGITGGNRAWESSVDFERLLPNTNAFWCEDGNPASVTREGILVSNIRSYKLGRTFDNVVFNSIGESPVMLAETMAFNPHSLTRPADELKPHVDFYKDHLDFYLNTENIANVAVLRTFPSMAYNSYSTHESTILFEQTLIQSHIMFDILYAKHLSGLSKYSVLILPNQESLSDEEIDLIRQFVKAGGSIIATENTSLYTPWRRERSRFGLSDVFGIDRPEGVTQVQQTTYGKGKVVYIPDIIPDIDRPATAPMRNAYWKLPKNWQVLVDAVQWTVPSLPVRIKAPLTLVAELTKKPESGIQALHLINYAAENAGDSGVDNIVVEMEIPSNKSVGSIELYTPATSEAVSLKFTATRDKVRFTVPHLDIYSMAVLKLA